MINGIFHAAAAMKARMATQDVIANNLANSSTSGFQREIAAVELIRLAPTAAANRGPAAAGTPARPAAPRELLRPYSVPDPSAGTIRKTGASADVALEGSGYLVAQTAQGERLIRGGTLSVSPQGVLVGPSGDPLLGTSGQPITVGAGEWRIAPDGRVSAGGAEVGQLRIAAPAGEMRREGALLMSAAQVQELAPGSVRVLQGYLEGANVDPVREMVDMIASVRAYESAQKSVQAQDQTLQGLLDVLRR